MPGASEPESVSTRQQRIAELAKQSPEMGFTSLAHHLDLEWLWRAFQRTRKDGAVGVDGQTGADFAGATLDKLRSNLESLRERALSGTYRAPPVRRAYILKGSGPETRPLGIPTFEDKVLQRAVVMLLEPIYEQDFRNCSYGYRPGRSAHQALDAVWQLTMGTEGGWIVEVDIRKFFDTLDHAHLRAFLQRRVRDGVLLRLIGKWLNAGVLEEGAWTTPEEGTPQGGVISPLLANIYLHYVLDVWFEQEVKPRLRGRAFLIRYADDFVMGFACEADARRVLEVLPKRFGRFGLTLHPEKTRLVSFQKPLPGNQKRQSRPGTFDLLGFTHYWGRSRRGFWVAKQKTACSRFSRAARTVGDWCRRNLHRPVWEQHQKLRAKLVGHYAYYGITGNIRALRRFHRVVTELWYRWLARRQRKGYFAWRHYCELLQRFPLPPATVVHSVYRRVATP
jgi:RNA-directed DNA polymerase